MAAGVDFGVAVADSVEEAGEAADGVVGFDGEVGEAKAEFHGGEVFGSGDLVAFEQAQ